jgi:hypothetical protein
LVDISNSPDTPKTERLGEGGAVDVLRLSPSRDRSAGFSATRRTIGRRKRWRAARSQLWALRRRGTTRLAEVAVVQAADFWKLHDLAHRGELNGPERGRILVEREVCARLMVIGEIAGQDAAQVSLAEDEHVIQTFASD